MKQYIEMKKKHPDAVLLFRVGDFYETFSDDAVSASEILGITLTRRANGAAAYVELAGFPHHALDTYLPKLVRAGKRVAICEQLEDPKLTKKLVKRGITELVTPGVTLNDNVLDGHENNYLASLHTLSASAAGDRRSDWGVSFLDISTGEFLAAEGPAAYIDKLLSSYAPKEIVVKRGMRQRVPDTFSGKFLTFELDDWVFTGDAATGRLLAQFHTAGLKGFGIENMPLAEVAAGACLHYLDITEHTRQSHITRLTPVTADSNMRLDRFTVRNLELVHTMSPEGRSLRSVLDRTLTPMGSRLMAAWLTMPLRDVRKINRRLDVVEYFFREPRIADDIAEQLHFIGDLARMGGKIASQRINPREMQQLAGALRAIQPIKARLMASDNEVLTEMARALDPCEDLADRIGRTVVSDPPASVGKKSPTIAAGANAELDDLRSLAHNSKQYMEEMRQREIAATGITSLKLGYNNVFGYFFEVTNTHKDKVPDTWTRKSTLANAERYVTDELKTYEERLSTAEERIQSLELSMFNDLIVAAGQRLSAIQLDAQTIANIDCLLAFMRVSAQNHYNRPVVDDSLTLSLTNARHPVIEQQLPAGDPYIANSVSLDNDRRQILMITGPNMSGKSALLRQTALNVIMAQAGCFVAADSAHIGIVDKIFTRVGASDNISSGESTFMVEMTEAAAIVNNLTERSLVLFDELGRGTSTYDGISIAWAIVEYLHDAAPGHPKTLFATHYHELNEMQSSFARIVNMHVAVKEIDGKVVFIRKLEDGGSEHSFGIHVARLAGMPEPIVRRADQVLAQLERQHDGDASKVGAEAVPHADTPDMKAATSAESGMQLSFFQLDDPVLSQVRDEIIGIDINNLTPIQALTKLNDIRKILTGK